MELEEILAYAGTLGGMLGAVATMLWKFRKDLREERMEEKRLQDEKLETTEAALQKRHDEIVEDAKRCHYNREEDRKDLISLHRDFADLKQEVGRKEGQENLAQKMLDIIESGHARRS